MNTRGQSVDSSYSNVSRDQYKQMIQEEQQQHSALPCTLQMMESTGLVQSDSMDLQNDPRFFQSNVLNKRLAAFGSLSVVSGLMVSTCTHIISAKKEMHFQNIEGCLRTVNFGLMSVVLFLNVVATYVAMAQTYHTYRLETAGPTGFEIATSYYLNPNIVAWRHFAVDFSVLGRVAQQVKCMLNGLTLFVVSTGIRVCVSFEELTDKAEITIKTSTAHLLAAVFGLFFAFAGILMHYIHEKHQGVFRMNYAYAKDTERPFMNNASETVHDLMSSQRSRSWWRAPDV